ncbi:MAG: dihydrodipicolinate reductase [Candidatus Caldarchaeales archaeon]
MSKIKFAVYGLGPIGSLIVKHGLERKGLELVAALDIDPSKIDRDVGEVVGLGRKIGILVERDAGRILKETQPDVVLHATGSYLDKVYSQILNAVEVGADVISTCETLSYPYYRYPEITRKLDEEAKRQGSTILGTGINPGFLLDLLPAIMTTPCIRVERVTARRVLEASKRRESFRKKIGVGMNLSGFEEMIRRGEITGHVGYAESVCLLAEALNIKLDKVEERQDPVLAQKDIGLDGIVVEKNRVRGIHGYGIGYRDGKEIIRIEFEALVGAEGEFEEITIEGEPKICWRSSFGVPGDVATVGVVLNYIPIVLEAEPGVVTINRLRPPRYSLLGD